MNNKKIFIIIGGLLLVAVLALVWLANSPLLDTLTGSGDSNLNLLRAFSVSRDYWQVKIRQEIGLEQLEELGGPERMAEMLTKQIGESLSREYAEQMEYSVKPGEKVEEGVVITTVLRGQDPAIIGPVMFDDLYGLYDLLAGPIKLTMTGEVKVGTPLHLNLLVNSSTGYGWYGMERSEVATKKGEKFEADWDVYPGTPEIQSMDFIFDTSGEVEFVVDYTRPWERTDNWQMTDIVIFQREFMDFFDFFPDIPQFGRPNPFDVLEYESELIRDTGGLPSTYSWISNDNRLKQPLDLVIGNQQWCGSCWSFATTGVTEAAFQVQKGTGSYDLSEQYLVACNQPGVRCGGWNAWFAFPYYKDQDGLLNNSPGTVLEADMPYNPSNFACQTVANHPYKLATWHAVLDSWGKGHELQYVDDIKQAMYQYGPVAVAVCGSGAFQVYNSGVFDADNCQNVNHQVLLVGWDDNTESWILKNSWGTNWGENGYMRIKWGTNMVGFEPMYVIVQ